MTAADDRFREDIMFEEYREGRRGLDADLQGWVVADYLGSLPDDEPLDPDTQRMLEDWSGWKPQASDNDKISSKEN